MNGTARLTAPDREMVLFKKLFIFLVCFIGTASPVLAGILDGMKACQVVKDPKSRLACLDEALRISIVSEQNSTESVKTRVEVPSKKDALTASLIEQLTRLRIKTETGINRNEFQANLAEIKFAFVSYEQQFSPLISDLELKLKETVSAFEDSNEILKLQAITQEDYVGYSDDRLAQRMFIKYQTVRRDIERNRYRFNFNSALSLVWIEAGKALDEVKRYASPAYGVESGHHLNKTYK